MSNSAIDIDALTPAERWDLIERMWGSLGDAASELTPEQQSGLALRAGALDDDIDLGLVLRFQDEFDQVWRDRS